MNEEANIVENKFQLNLTEWEIDAVYKALNAVNYPGTHVDLAHKLIEKIKGSMNGNS